ncbi:hypothetical protein SAMN05444398_101154 [Roseovarius pacificus]|uniref:Uncharacterized protein n=1 Tax=Roseovarius pacificus TaxID=337701 RepID=A0A1M6WU16_9RHOB|nr:hypothetical protein SAMN05444398_101154 [Roseovarius pacificus]
MTFPRHKIMAVTVRHSRDGTLRSEPVCHRNLPLDKTLAW